MHDKINCKIESYRLSSTCGAPRNHTNVQPVDAHVWRQLHLSAAARFRDSHCILLSDGMVETVVMQEGSLENTFGTLKDTCSKKEDNGHTADIVGKIMYFDFQGAAPA